MDPKSIVGILVALLFVAYLMPVGLDAYSDSRDTATDEQAEYDNFTSLSEADQANYTSDYAADGEPPTPWSSGEKSLFAIVGILTVIIVVRGMKGD